MAFERHRKVETPETEKIEVIPPEVKKVEKTEGVISLEIQTQASDLRSNLEKNHKVVHQSEEEIPEVKKAAAEIPEVKKKAPKKKRQDKKYPNKVSIMGNTIEVRDFRAIIKKNGEQINTVLKKLIADYNKKNYNL